MAHLIPVRPHCTYILNEAVLMNNEKLVQILAEEYICNPFSRWLLPCYSNSVQYAYCQTHNISLSKNNSEDKILGIFKKLYGHSMQYDTHIPLDSLIEPTRNEFTIHPHLEMSSEKSGLYFDKYDEEISSEEDYEYCTPMREQVILEPEKELGSVYIGRSMYDSESEECSDEECVSLPWLRQYITKKKRKKYSNDIIIDSIRKSEEVTSNVQKLVNNFESVHMEEDLADGISLNVEALNRKWDKNKKVKLDEDAPTQDFIRKRGDLCIPKFNFNSLAQETLLDFKNAHFSPHAIILMQQAAEDYLSQQVYPLNNEISFTHPDDEQILKANNAITTQDHGTIWFRYQGIEHAGLMEQLKTFCPHKSSIMWEEIKKVVSILQEENDIEIDDSDYPNDHISVNSEDSLISSTALHFADTNDLVFKMPDFMIFTDLEKIEKYSEHYVGTDGIERDVSTEIHENSNHHLVTTNDRDLVVSWQDNCESVEGNRVEMESLQSFVKQFK